MNFNYKFSRFFLILLLFSCVTSQDLFSMKRKLEYTSDDEDSGSVHKKRKTDASSDANRQRALTPFPEQTLINNGDSLAGPSVDKKTESIDFTYLVKLMQTVPQSFFAHKIHADDKKKESFYKKLCQYEEFQYLYDDFVNQLNLFAMTMKNQLDHKACWLDGQTPEDWFYELSGDYFTSYVQKKKFPVGATIYAWGDLHGGFHSLINMLASLFNQNILDNNFKIKKPNVYFVFHGDYVDRGLFGVETLYTLMRLKNANPEHVILVRGNHEDNVLNGLCGFELEIGVKCSEACPLLNSFYNMLALAFFIDDQILCCHGGPDFSYLNRQFFEAKDPVCYDLVTEDNYNPLKLFSCLSGEVLNAMINEVMTLYFQGLIHSFLGECVDNMYKYLWEFCDNEDCFHKILKSIKHNKKEYAGQVRTLQELLDTDFQLLEQTMDVIEQHQKLVKTLDKQKLPDVYNKIIAEIDGKNGDKKNTRAILDGLYTNIRAIADIVKDSPKELKEYNVIMEVLNQRYKDFVQAVTDFTCYGKQFDTGYQKNLRLFLQEFLKKGDTEQSTAEIAKRYGLDVEGLSLLLDDPRSPLHILLTRHFDGPQDLEHFGFAYHDFNTDAKGQDLSLQKGDRSILGQRLTHEMMKLQGITCVLRAHQHYGPMMDLLQKQGIVDLWNDNAWNTGTQTPLCTGKVFTYPVTKSSSRMGTAYDSDNDIFACLTKTEKGWMLEKMTVIYRDMLTLQDSSGSMTDGKQPAKI